MDELSQTNKHYTEIEWKFKNIFSYSGANQSYYSKCFSFSDSTWRLRIFPCGHSSFDSVGWISIFLVAVGMKSEKSVTYSFVLKNVDGTEEIRTNHNYVFGPENDNWGNFKFLKRSELKKEKYQLAPSGTLTIICNMRLDDDSEYISSFPAVEKEAKCLEKSELLKREDELAPSGDLTLACSMKLKDGLDLESISRLNKLSENLENLFICKRGSDATLKVQDKDFAVHRSILMARSPVLGAMFEVDMEEKTTGIVSIVDCHPGAFQDFLTYIYSGKFIISSNDASQLYRIAHKYDVEELQSDCVAYMIHNLSVDTLLDAAIIGHEFGENELKNKTQDFFNKEFKKIAHSSKWKSFLKDNLSLGQELLENMADNLESLAQVKEGTLV